MRLALTFFYISEPCVSERAHMFGPRTRVSHTASSSGMHGQSKSCTITIGIVTKNERGPEVIWGLKCRRGATVDRVQQTRRNHGAGTAQSRRNHGAGPRRNHGAITAVSTAHEGVPPVRRAPRSRDSGPKYPGAVFVAVWGSSHSALRSVAAKQGR